MDGRRPDARDGETVAEGIELGFATIGQEKEVLGEGAFMTRLTQVMLAELLTHVEQFEQAEAVVIDALAAGRAAGDSHSYVHWQGTCRPRPLASYSTSNSA